VRDDDHRHVFARQLLHDQIDLVDEFGIERRGGLVEQHDLRLHGQRPGDRHPLFLSAGEPGGIGIDLVREAHLVEHGQRKVARRRLGHALQFDGRDRNVVGDAEVRKQIEVLEHHAHLLAHLIDVTLERAPAEPLVDLHAVKPDLAGIQRLQMVDRPQQGALARAARPDHGDDLATPDAEVDAAQNVEPAIGLARAAHVDHRANIGHRDNSTIPSIQRKAASRIRLRT